MRTRGIPPSIPDEVNALVTIRQSVAEHGYPPSQREIAAACGWASVSQAHRLLRTMEAKGLLKMTPGIPRAMQVTDEGLEMIDGAEMVAKTTGV